MANKVYKPTSPGRRGMTGYSFEEITSTTPERSLLVPLRRKAGRNVRGKITVRHQGGGHIPTDLLGLLCLSTQMVLSDILSPRWV